MRKTFFLLIICRLLLLTPVFSQYQEKETLLIMHPTVNNISTIMSLMEQGIFNPGNIKLKGVYFEGENYDYTDSEDFIKEHNLSFKLEEVKASLNPEDIFRKNDCSPAFERLFEESRGVIFFGGPDIPPYVYGEKTSTLTVITDPYRHYFEVSFLFHLLGGSGNPEFIPLLEKNPDYLVVGFCLGMQTMNVATGGTLVQDIPMEIYGKTTVEDILKLPVDQQHRNYANNISDSVDLFWGNIHPIKIKEGSWLMKKGGQPSVVSSHHQSVKTLGLNLRVAATSADGKIIESVDHLKYPHVYGFQFHPEVPDIYSDNNVCRMKVSGEQHSLKYLIEEGKGYEFHKNLWKTFSEILSKTYSSDTKTL